MSLFLFQIFQIQKTFQTAPKQMNINSPFKIMLFSIILSFLLLFTNSTANVSKLKQKGYYPFPKIIWIYWSSQNSMQLLDQLFLIQLKKFISKPQHSQWKINFINDSNINTYLNNLDEFYASIKKDGNTIPANKADMLRLFILQQHGGVYVDLTTFFIQNLDWLQLQNLYQNKQVINKHSQYSVQPDVLLFYWDRHQFRNHYVGQNGHLMNNFPGFQSWFIASKPNSQLIRDWKNKFIEYYPLNAEEIFSDLKTKDIYIGDFQFEAYHAVYFSLYYVFHQKQRQLDRQTSIWNRKNVNFYYKVWSINCLYGPCLTYYQSNFQDNQYEKDFMVKSIKQMTNDLKIDKIRYFVKYTRYHVMRTSMILNIMTNKDIASKNLIQFYQSAKQSMSSCKKMIYINEQSFIMKYLLNQIPLVISAKYFKENEIKQFNEYCQNIEKQKSKNKKFDLINYLRKYIPEIFLINNPNYLWAGIIYISILIISMIMKTTVLKLKKQKQDQKHFLTQNFHQKKILTYNCPQKQHIRPKQSFKSHKITPSQSQQQTDIAHNIQLNLTETVFSGQNNIFDLVIIDFLQQISLMIYHLLLSIKIKIPNFILNLAYALVSFKFMWFVQTKYQKQVFQITSLVLIVCILLQKVAKIKSKHQHIQIKQNHIQTMCSQILIISGSKLIAQIIYSQQQYVDITTFYIGILCVKFIQYKLEYKLIQLWAKNAKAVHRNIFFILLVGLAIIPNGYLIRFGDRYLVQILFNCFIIYSHALAFIVIAVQVFLFIKKLYLSRNIQQLPSQFNYSKSIVFRYFCSLVVFIFIEKYWNRLYDEQTKKLYFLSFMLLQVSNSYSCNKNKEFINSKQSQLKTNQQFNSKNYQKNQIFKLPFHEIAIMIIILLLIKWHQQKLRDNMQFFNVIFFHFFKFIKLSSIATIIYRIYIQIYSNKRSILK